jgi:hypothetical protein
MTTDNRTAAALRAWETYLIINPSASKERRDALRLHLQTRSLSDDPEMLAVEGLKFLKQLEGRNGSPAADGLQIARPDRGRLP